MMGRASRLKTVPGRQKPRGVLLTIAVLLALLLAACGAEDPGTPVASNPTPDTLPAGSHATATPRESTPSSAATATPRATPSPTRTPRPVTTPTPLPPPAPAIGDSVRTNGWVISISDFETLARIGNSTPEGMFLYLRMTITNAGTTPEAFPFEGLIVVDQNDETHFLHVAATRESLTYDFGFDIAQQVQPGETHNVAAAFDIPFDSTGLRLTSPSRVFEIRIEYRDPPK